MIGFLILPGALILLVVLGPVVAEAWRTRTLPEGCEVTHLHQSSSSSGFATSSGGDCGYESVLPDRIVTRHGAVVSLVDHQDALL